MLAVMQELFNHHYTRDLYAEHPFILDYGKNILAAKKEMVQHRAVEDMQPNVLTLDLKER